MMAMAVQKLFKDAQVTIGPWIERGFYYDFDLKQPLTDKDLKQIKKEMQKISKAGLPFIREEVSLSFWKEAEAEAPARLFRMPLPYLPGEKCPWALEAHVLTSSSQSFHQENGCKLTCMVYSWANACGFVAFCR
jgi:hypothetical protein